MFEASSARATQSYLPVGLESEYAKFSKVVSDGVSAMASGALDADGAADQIHDELSREFF